MTKDPEIIPGAWAGKDAYISISINNMKVVHLNMTIGVTRNNIIATLTSISLPC